MDNPDLRTAPSRFQSDSPDPSFLGTERFAVERCLGAGGMGVVYRVFDRDRGKSVALKTLRQASVQSRYELKREFRSRQGLHHPNLITLYELFTNETQCFFTMELVSGVPFCDYFRQPSAGETRESWPISQADDGPIDPLRHSGPERPPETTLRTGPKPISEAALRSVLRQVVSAIAALHRSGKLHRDLKPTNVLITQTGRAVVLDFGLAQELAPRDPGLSYQERLVAGTPAYMAPEQAAGRAASTASDWYSLGVMLYQTLCGRLPFSGSAAEVMEQKRTLDPPPLPAIPGVSRDLAELCLALLAREPERRPRVEELALRLGLPAEPGSNAPRPFVGDPFIGREFQLETLRQALGRVRAGSSEVVFVHGPAGVGKSRLLEQFDSQVATEQGALIFSGRPRPRERLSFKALDDVVDRMGGWLREQRGVEGLLPRHWPAILRLFPTLGRVPGLVQAQHPKQLPSGGQAERAAAFDAFRELLARIGDRHLLVIRIDDLRWADTDGLELLRHLFAPDAPVCALFILGLATEHTLPVPLQSAADSPLVGFTDLAVPPLDPEESTRLALAQLSNRVGALRPAVETEGAEEQEAIQDAAKAIALKSGGLPGAIVNLTRNAIGPNRQAAQLTDDPQLLFQLLCAHGAPVPASVLARAAGFDNDRSVMALGELLSANHCNIEPGDPDDLVDMVDMVDMVDGRVDAATEPVPPLSSEPRRELHRKLAAVFEADGLPAEAARHRRKAGDLGHSIHLLDAAGRRAHRGLAFDGAIALFEEALELDAVARALNPSERVSLLVQLATCLEERGRHALAASYLESAALDADPEFATSLTRRALVARSRSRGADELMTAGINAAQREDSYTLFDGLPRSAAEQLLQTSRVLSGNAGEFLVRAGTQATDFFVVMKGQVELCQPGIQTPPIGENSILGEVGFLLEQTRGADVRALVDGTRMLAVDRASLEELATESPRLALRLVMNLARVVCAKLESVRHKVLRAQEPKNPTV
ncbi:MAG: hypothetical protein RJA70_289 [Pseudomonadota bacterium]|jgi:serine/threonine protein kinase/CRP-like cAMP-binding protein